jgi:DNA-binding transcriptional regulator GbsR (MarR family)
MSADNSNSKKKEFVEKVSLVIEEIGQPRISGQIMGWLMVCDPPKQSFSDLVEELGVSKASISNMTRMLLQAGLIEKVRIPGEREIYFQIKEGAWVGVMEKHLESINSLQRISKEGLELLEEDPDTDKSRLEEMNKFYQFAEKNMPQLIEQYKKENLS